MKKIFYLAYTLLITCAIFELSGLLYFYYEHDRIFYLRENDPENRSTEPRDTAPQSTYFRLSPYFGYSLQSGVSLKEYLSAERLQKLSEVDSSPAWLSTTTNNYGLFSRYNYPYFPANSQEFVIGIFGGSVAHWFAIQAEERLSHLLKELPQLQGRQVRILNFAAGGYKQPQQLFLLNFFLVQGQKFDLVLNIDGFNEIALSDRNREYKVDPSMPSAQHIAAFAKYLSREQLDSSYIRLLAKLLTAKEQATRTQKISDSSRFASIAFIYRFFHIWHSKTYVEAQLEFDKIGTDLDSTSLIQLQTITEYKNFQDIKNKSLTLWLESSKMMKTLSEESGIPYLHILQPNQYVSKKSFSEEEKKLALTDSAYNVEAIRSGYEALKGAAQTFKEHGLQFFDATGIFDNETSITFSDNCCHLNQRGNDILAFEIGEVLGTLLDLTE